MKAGVKFSYPILIFYLTISYNLYSQGGHYWTQQYGTRSMLLSGSVIGGVDDLGAIYYNPARLGFIEKPVLLLSADVYQLTRIKIDNAVGNNINKTQSNFDGVPSLAAGTFNISFLPNHHFAYAILSRQRSDIGFDYKEEVYGDVISQWPGEEYFEGQINIKTKTQEDCFGFSWAHALNQKFSLGISSFLSVVKSDRGNHIQLHALSEDGQVGSYDYNRDFNFTTFSLIWKLAAA